MRIPAEIEEAGRAHAAWCAPNEACGLLAKDEADAIRFFYPITNLDEAPDRFTLDPAELLRAADHAEGMGWDLGGVMHSHPGGRAYPSATDIADWATPSWLAMVVADGEIGYFWIEDGEVRPIPVGVSIGGESAPQSRPLH